MSYEENLKENLISGIINLAKQLDTLEQQIQYKKGIDSFKGFKVVKPAKKYSKKTAICPICQKETKGLKLHIKYKHDEKYKDMIRDKIAHANLNNPRFQNRLKHICSICKREYTGFGNNAEPINNRRCCDNCNSDIVIPVRMKIGNR